MFSATVKSRIRPRRWRSSRDVPEPGVEVAIRVCVRHILSGNRHAAVVRLAQARDRVDQLGLAVAVDACDGDDLAGANVQRHPTHLLDPPVVEDTEVIDGEQCLPGRRLALVDGQQHFAADHQPRQPLFRRTLCR